jgi:hypothetical protein
MARCAADRVKHEQRCWSSPATEAAADDFVAAKTPSGISDTYTFSTPFRMMLNSGATFYFSPSNSVAVSGYLVKE